MNNLEILFEIIQYIMILSLAYILTRLCIISSSKPPKLLGQDTGISLGMLFPYSSVSTINKGVQHVFGDSKDGTIVFITSPSCNICKSLYPIIAEGKRGKIAFFSFMVGEADQVREVLDRYSIQAPATAIDTDELSQKLLLDGYPYAYFLSPAGIILSKGLINTRKDIEILIDIGRKNQIYLDSKPMPA